MLTFLAPQFLWALLALPLVVVLHFVRARKERHEVSALFLWRQAKELAQQRRRFSPTWLLILQLLFVALATFALAQPNLTLDGAPDRVLVIDASASMAARDSDGVRLDKARVEAEELLADAGRVAVIRAGLDATVVQGLSEDHAEVRQALRNLTAADAGVELRRALELAGSVAPDASLHLFTDRELPPGFDATLHPVAGDAQNLGISAFELTAQQAFVSVVSSSPRPQEVELRLERDGTPLARTTLLVPANGQANNSFPIDGAAGFYRAVLDTPEWDALALDDEAYAGNRALQVLVAPPTAAVERALSALPNLNTRVTRVPPTTNTATDVTVLVGATPGELSPGRYLLFAPPSESPSYQTIVEWDRTDPLLRFVDLTSVRIGVGEAAPELPAGNWRVLARTGALEPAILQLSEPGLEVVALRFHPSQTDMTSRVAFPILVANVIDAFRGEDRLQLGSPLPANAAVSINGQDAAGVRRAAVPGVYAVADTRYAVSLLAAEESRLPAAAAPAPQPTPLPASQETTRQVGAALWLVLVALVVLLAEWLVWSRSSRAWARS